MLIFSLLLHVEWHLMYAGIVLVYKSAICDLPAFQCFILWDLIVFFFLPAILLFLCNAKTKFDLVLNYLTYLLPPNIFISTVPEGKL